jgi:hypothetical protein
LSNNRRAQCAQLFLAGNPIQQDATDSFEYAKDYVFDRLDVAFPTLNTRVHLKCGTCKFDKELASRRDRVIMCQYFSDARIRSWRIYGKWIKESYANKQQPSGRAYVHTYASEVDHGLAASVQTNQY